MGFIAAGLAVAAVGAGVSAYGAAKNAKAQQDAAKAAGRSEGALYERQNKNLKKLIKSKEEKLYNIGNIFERFESTGAFGDTAALSKLRKAQDDFASLAAGDFTDFRSAVDKSIGDALLNTQQSGAPIGAFAGLAADTQMQYRKEGIATAVGLSDFFANQSNNLLSMEFGIMDQKFNTGYQLDRNRVSGVNQANQQAAAQEGVGTVAAGNALQTVGSSLSSYSNLLTARTNAQYANAPRAIPVNEPLPMPSYAQSFSAPSYYSPPPSYIPPAPSYPEVLLPTFDDTQIYTDDVGVLPPLQNAQAFRAPSYNSNYSSALSQVGRRIVSGSV